MKYTCSVFEMSGGGVHLIVWNSQLSNFPIIQFPNYRKSQLSNAPTSRIVPTHYDPGYCVQGREIRDMESQDLRSGIWGPGTADPISDLQISELRWGVTILFLVFIRVHKFVYVFILFYKFV